jgi:hypothetical protein
MPAFTVLDSGLATYSGCFSNYTAVAGDVWTLGGFGGQTKVRYLELDLPAVAAVVRVQLIRRNGPDTGGTRTTPAPAKADSNDQPSGNTLSAYSAAPTPSAAVAVVDVGTVLGVAAPNLLDRAIFTYEQVTSKPIVLNGGNDFLAINLGTGGAGFDLSFWWTER